MDACFVCADHDTTLLMPPHPRECVPEDHFVVESADVHLWKTPTECRFLLCGSPTADRGAQRHKSPHPALLLVPSQLRDPVSLCKATRLQSKSPLAPVEKNTPPNAGASDCRGGVNGERKSAFVKKTWRTACSGTDSDGVAVAPSAKIGLSRVKGCGSADGYPSRCGHCQPRTFGRSGGRRTLPSRPWL